jgi:hypothetical protein
MAHSLFPFYHKTLTLFSSLNGPIVIICVIL